MYYSLYQKYLQDVIQNSSGVTVGTLTITKANNLILKYPENKKIQQQIIDNLNIQNKTINLNKKIIISIQEQIDNEISKLYS